MDQLLVGTYGMLAIECMAYGKPTICYIRDDLTSKFPDELPILNANTSNIRDKLEKLINDFDLRNKLGRASRKYVEKYHDSNMLAEKALQIYNS